MRAYIAFLIAACAAFAQPKSVSPVSTASPVDFSGAASTKSVKAGTSLPGTCAVGELFFKTDATAGANVYGCTATNTWTAQAGSAGVTTHHIWLDAGSSDNSSPFANTWRASFANVDLDGYGFETGSSPAFATIAFRDAGSVVYFRYPIPSTYDGSPITVDLEADIDENNNAPSQLDITPSSTCVTDGGAYKGVTFTAGSVVSTAITSDLLGKRKKISFTMPATCAAGDRLIGKLERSASDTANNKILADGLTINIVF